MAGNLRTLNTKPNPPEPRSARAQPMGHARGMARLHAACRQPGLLMLAWARRQVGLSIGQGKPPTEAPPPCPFFPHPFTKVPPALHSHTLMFDIPAPPVVIAIHPTGSQQGHRAGANKTAHTGKGGSRSSLTGCEIQPLVRYSSILPTSGIPALHPSQPGSPVSQPGPLSTALPPCAAA